MYFRVSVDATRRIERAVRSSTQSLASFLVIFFT